MGEASGARSASSEPAAGLDLVDRLPGVSDPRLPYAARRRAEIWPFEFLHASTPDLPALKEPHPIRFDFQKEPTLG